MSQSVRSAVIAANCPPEESEYEHRVITGYSPFLTKKDAIKVPVTITGITDSETLAEFMPLDAHYFQVMRYLSYKARTVFNIQRIKGDDLPTIARLTADDFVRIEGQEGQRWLDEGRRYKRINVTAAPVSGFRKFIETFDVEDEWSPLGSLVTELKAVAERNLLVDSINEDLKQWTGRFGMQRQAAIELGKRYTAWRANGRQH